VRVAVLVDLLPESVLQNSSKYRLKVRDNYDDDDDDDLTRSHGKSVLKILYILFLKGY
jgi:hypothetical protein